VAPTPAQSVPDLFLERVDQTPNAEAFRFPTESGWTSLTWAQTEARVRSVASGLRALGIEPEQVCAILSQTRIEWVLADFGIVCAGAATNTIYPSSTPEETAYILRDSGAVVAFAENAEQVAKIASRRAELPVLRHVVVFEGMGSPDGWVISFADLEARGREWDAAHPGRFEEIAQAIRPDHLATLIYTSGTTGTPKGVELTHRCWVDQSAAVEKCGILDHPDAVQLFWLPLAHSFGKMIGTAQLRLGFPTAIDGRVEKIVENLAQVRPTFVCAVPRIFEKVHNRIRANAHEGGRLKAGILEWALGVGRQVSRLRETGRKPGPVLAARHALADRLVFSKVRALFGGRLHFFVSGSAPLSRDIAEFFDAMGVVILEGYGLTESSAATHVNLPWRYKLGTVGPALPGIEVKLAEDGEILMRGSWIMRGYRGLPEQTRDALDDDGWLHTGDVGAIDPEGYLSVTDRKKDLIKTSGGKYVAPTELETKLKALSPLVSQVLVHGDRRNFVSALVTLDREAVAKWAAGNGLGHVADRDLASRVEVRAALQRDVDRLNATLPRFATLKKFAILPEEFSEAAGEVTASQKLKRKLIEQRYRGVLDALYGETVAA
jgi:long-chain acyl-CoA synthetase